MLKFLPLPFTARLTLAAATLWALHAPVATAAETVTSNASAMSSPKAAAAKSTTKSAAKSAGKSAPAKPTKAFPVKKVVPPKSTVSRRRVRASASIPWTGPRPSPVSLATRSEAREGVLKKVTNGIDIPIENAAALVPFFEQLYRHQKGDIPGPVRVLHYGDSHTAADELTGSMREQFQQAFGDGGAGYSFAGRPWNGYRRLDVKTGASGGWYTDGLVGRTG